MENVIYIPIKTKNISPLDKLRIDMSNLQFDVPEDKKKFYSFVYIRNSGIDAELDFSKCEYKDKEEFLLMFLTSDIEVKCHALALTWIEILLYNGSDINSLSILTKDEIKQFIKRNIMFCNNVKQLIKSLPLYAIYCFHRHNESSMNLDEFATTDCENIKLSNVYQLAECNNFLLLITNDCNIKPVFYTKMFTNNSNSFDLMRIMDRLPYINLLIAMFGDSNMQNTAIDRINKVYENMNTKEEN